MPLRCLIVDDNVAFLQTARGLLERQGVTVVGVATTAQEGLRQAVELQPDVVLVDIDLGEESGFTLVQDLADAGARAGSEAILISTHPQDDFADLVAESAALGFLPKSELSRDAIQRLLDRQEPGR